MTEAFVAESADHPAMSKHPGIGSRGRDEAAAL
jgi:hypothetical protein